MVKTKNKRKLVEEKPKANEKADTKNEIEKEPESDYESDQVIFCQHPCGFYLHFYFLFLGKFSR